MSENLSTSPARGGLTITALALGSFAFLFLLASRGPISALFGLVAVGCAIPALRRINKGLAGGRKMAIAALILGIIGTLGGIGSIPSTPATTASATYSSGSSYTATQTQTRPAYGAPNPVQAASPTVIPATQMGDDFESNQLAAEKKWGGQYVQFTSRSPTSTAAVSRSARSPASSASLRSAAG